MFLGHYGVAFALKRVEPKLSLGTLFIAVQLVELLWGCFVLLGWERARIIPGYTAVTPLEFLDYPISHSLVGTLAWSIVGMTCYYAWPTRDTRRHWQAAALVGVAVFSHYPLDVLVHLPDLPVTAGNSTKLGFGLWNSFAATVAAELLVFGAGIAVYVAFRSHRHPVRPARLAIVGLLLLGTYLANLLGPPPPSMTVVAVSVIGLVVVVGLLGAWADHRATGPELAAAGLSSKR
ncbi:MAG: hypothetical protein ACREMX_17400 [Gemmatimonadales bacterium]